MPDEEEFEPDWMWILGDGECWCGLCPHCGGREQTDLPLDVSTIDLIAVEQTHRCGPLLPHLQMYEEFYGIDDLKRRMGFPEELI